MNHEVAQAPVQLDSVLLREPRLPNHLLLLVCYPIDSNLLHIQIKGRQALGQLFIHEVAAEFFVVQHVHAELVLSRLEDALLIKTSLNHLKHLLVLGDLLADITWCAVPIRGHALVFVLSGAGCCSRARYMRRCHQDQFNN